MNLVYLLILGSVSSAQFIEGHREYCDVLTTFLDRSMVVPMVLMVSPESWKSIQIHSSCLVVHVDASRANLSLILETLQLLDIKNKTLAVINNIPNGLDQSIQDIHRSYAIQIQDQSGSELYPIHTKASLRGKFLTASFVDLWPYMNVNEEIVTGADQDILAAMKSALQFQASLTLAQTALDYFMNVSKQQIDFGVGQATITFDRIHWVDYGMNMFPRELGFVSALTPRVDKFDTLIRLFDSTSWIFILGCLVAMFLVLISMDYLQNGHQIGFDDVNVSWMRALTALVQQSQPVKLLEQGRFRARFVLLAIWLLGGFYLSLFYESTLLTTLTIINYKRPIDTPQEIIDSGLPVYTLDATFLSRSLRCSPLPIYQELYQKAVVERGGLMPLGKRNGPQYVKEVDEGQAFMTRITVEGRSIPNRRFHSHTYFVGSSAWIFPRGSNLKTIFDQTLLTMQQTGLLKHAEDKFIFERMVKDQVFLANDRHQKAEFAKIDIREFLPIFIMVLIGWALALVVFGLEHAKRKISG